MRNALQTQLSPLLTIKHPNLQQIYEIFAQDDRLYMVETYLDDNATALLSNGFNEDRITTLLQQLLSALSQIHQVNVAHRNISPNAIFRQANTEHFILKDFGVLQHIRSLLSFAPQQKYVEQVKSLVGIVFLAIRMQTYICLRLRWSAY